MFAIEAIMKFWDDANTQGKGLRAKECAFWGDYLPHLLKKGKLPIILKTFSSTNKVNITPILFKKWFRRHLGNLAQKCSCTPQRKGNSLMCESVMKNEHTQIHKRYKLKKKSLFVVVVNIPCLPPSIKQSLPDIDK